MTPDIEISHNLDLSPAPAFTRAEILDELDRVSRTFLRKKTALRNMLRFVVEATLDGNASDLKEYTIATLVFGKSETFDPRLTSLVRTQASKLRETLVTYYSSCSVGNGPWLWVPPGSYGAVFDQNPALQAKGTAAESRVVLDASVDKNVRIAKPTVLPSESNLDEIAEAVVRLQRENFTPRKLLPQLPESKGSGSAAAIIASEFEVQQTIVELDGWLLLTLSITAVPSHFVLLGNSIYIPWSGDSARAIALLLAPLSQFASSCAPFLGIQAFSQPVAPSSGASALYWKAGTGNKVAVDRQSLRVTIAQ